MKVLSAIFTVIGVLLFALLVYFQYIKLNDAAENTAAIDAVQNATNAALSDTFKITLSSDSDCRASVLVNGIAKAVFKSGEAVIYAGKHDTVEIFAPKNEICHVKVKHSEVFLPSYLYETAVTVDRRKIIFKIK